MLSIATLSLPLGDTGTDLDADAATDINWFVDPSPEETSPVKQISRVRSCEKLGDLSWSLPHAVSDLGLQK